MDKIILSILMMSRLTVYEMRVIIKRNFKSMCSDSLGGIQAAVKKLLAAEMVTCSEYVEKGVNKKRYSITDKGRKELLGWLNTPADMSDAKNMELGKLLFMGLVPAKERIALVGEIIALLEKELAEILGIQAYAQSEATSKQIQQIMAYWEYDAEYSQGIQDATQAASAVESARDIYAFQMLTLQYGIDNVRFQIEWFQSLKTRLEKGETL